MMITAAVLAEICSALPLSGSIYIWAAESAGPKYARFVGFIVAWWSCTAWMTFAAGNCQVRRNDCPLYRILSLNGNSDDSQLHRVPAHCLGDRVPRGAHERERQISGYDLGYFGRITRGRHRYQLSPTAMVLERLQVLCRVDDGRLSPLRHLAAHWGIEDLWI